MLSTGSSEAEHVTAVVLDLERAQAIARVFQSAMHWRRSSHELVIKRIGIRSTYIGVPPGPHMARMIWLGMDLRHDCLQHDHHSVALHDCPEVAAVPVSATFMGDVKPQLGLIEVQASLQVVHNKEWSDAIKC
jgi:hypothetical protein